MSKVFKAVGNAISSVVKGVVKAVSSVVKAVVNVVSSVVSFVTQPFMGLLGGMPDIPSAAAEAERQQGVLIQTQGSNVNIPVVYGYRKVGGTVVFAETGSTNNRYLYVAYVFSEGLVEGLREVFIDDWQLPVTLTASLNAGQVVDVTTDRYANRVRLQWYPGQYFSNPSSSPVGTSVKTGIFAEAPSFTNRMTFNGLAVLFARYEWKEIKTQADADNNPFSGNIPQVQVSLLGKRVASLLVESTETQDYDVNSIRYSTNPAEILLDYLRNPRYGKGLKNSDIHWDSWKKAARKCNTTVTYLSTNSDITGPILTCNYVLDTGSTIMSNVKVLLMGFRAYMPYIQGRYKLKIEDAGNDIDITSGVATIVMTAVASPYLKASYTGNVTDIVGNVTYTGIDKGAKYNVVSVSYVDPDQKFSVQQVVYPETEEERQIYIDKDGGRENKLDATFPTLTNYAMAKDMARLLFNKSRRQETCSLTISSEGLELEPGDNIRIQSNVLNFGTDPWRVISIKINDNMTVDIACVRNPDDIYPYTRVGEEDIVLAVYVPKGSIIYYPSSNNQPLIGLVPPTRALYPDDFAPNPTNPGGTNPDGADGGGVGGGSGGDGGGSGDTVNDPAADPPPPPPFEAVVVLKRSFATDLRNGNFMINLVFTQPADGLYSYNIIWWRVNRYSPWIEARKDEKPGPGGEITLTFGPLPPGDFQFYVRAYATDGRASTKVTQGTASIRANSIELNPSLTGIATASTIQVSEGWTVPASEEPTAPRYDDLIGRLSVRPKLTAGAPQDPRRMTVTLQQITNVLADPINTLIDGARFYYKQKDETYWNYEDYKFINQGQYFPGQTITFDLTGDFGGRVYPSQIIPNTINSGLQQYDFLVRLTYADGQPALKQFGPLRAPVEVNGFGEYNFVSIGTPDSGATVTSRSSDIPAGFNDTFKTVDQDPNKTAATGADLIPGINRMYAAYQDPKLTFIFNPPTTSVTKFRGYRIYYREVVAGTNPTFRSVDVPMVAGIDGKITYVLDGNGFLLNQRFEWAIAVLISSVSGIIEADNCLYARYSIPRNSTDDNLYPEFNFVQKNTREALGELRIAFPATPTPNPKSWIKKQVLVYDPNQSSVFTNAHITKHTSDFKLNIYMKLRFQAPAAGATHIVCYRRVYDIFGVQRTAVSTVAKFNGLGPWEKVRVALSSLPTDAEGFKTINLRGPIDPEYFNPYYQVTGGSTSLGTALVNKLYGAAGRWPYGYATDLAGIYPMWRNGVGNSWVTSSSTTPRNSWAQYLFLFDDAGVESTKGLLLTDFYTPQQASADYVSEADGFISKYGNVPKDLVIDDISVFNTIEAGYGRRLTDAISSVTISDLYMSATPYYGLRNAPPGKTAYDNVGYPLRLSGPSTGDTVY